MNSESKRAFFAILLSGVVLLLWQYMFFPKSNIVNGHLEEAIVKDETVSTNFKQVLPPINSPIKTNEEFRSDVFLLENNDQKIVLDSFFTIKEIQNKSANVSLDAVANKEKPLVISVLDGDNVYPLSLTDVVVEKSRVTAKALDGIVQVEISLGDNSRFKVKINSSRALKLRLALKIDDKRHSNATVPEFLIYAKDVERYQYGSDEFGDANIKWAGVDFDYHLFAFVLKDKSAFKFRANEKGELILDQAVAENEANFDLVFLKKNYDDLLAQGDNLHLAVDFGLLGIISVPILRGLQLSYSYIPNYGIAIIFITIIVRLLTFPLQYKSFKSMKKMQKLQPEMAAIREKYKEDPQRMQKETMDLFKKAGTNPFGGCLPLLLQLPIFFAFYTVLANAVELVGAPFYLWITDLSIKDPYFVLPIVMTLAMLLQQKITPMTTMDPMQQKIMLFMPVIFGFIMKDLPSGLALYILVSTIFGILQQFLVYKTTED